MNCKDSLLFGIHLYTNTFHFQDYKSGNRNPFSCDDTQPEITPKKVALKHLVIQRLNIVNPLYKRLLYIQPCKTPSEMCFFCEFGFSDIALRDPTLCPPEMTRRHRFRSGHVSLHNQPWKFWKTISTPFWQNHRWLNTSIIEKTMSTK